MTTGVGEIQYATLKTVDNQVFKGILHSVDENTGKIALKNVLVNKIKLPGLQFFYASNVQDLELTDGSSESTTVDTVTHSDQTKEKKIHTKQLPFKKVEPTKRTAGPKHFLGDDSGDQGIGSSAEENDNFEDYYEMDNFIMFCRTCNKFRDSITYLMSQEVIAVTFYGLDISRKGILSVIQVATEDNILIYDVLRLGLEGFVDGLQALLESPRVLKVIHDCRMISDALFHLFDVTLSNVFDTQVGGVFTFRVSSGGDWPRFVDSLPVALINHLGLTNEDVHHFFERDRSDKDEEVWLQRPLCNQLIQNSLKNLVHMIPLYYTLQMKLMVEFQLGVTMYLDNVRNLPQERVDKCMSSSHLLPFVFQDLPKLAADSVREKPSYKRPSYPTKPKRFVGARPFRGNAKAFNTHDEVSECKKDFTPESKCDTRHVSSDSKNTVIIPKCAQSTLPTSKHSSSISSQYKPVCQSNNNNHTGGQFDNQINEVSKDRLEMTTGSIGSLSEYSTRGESASCSRSNIQKNDVSKDRLSMVRGITGSSSVYLSRNESETSCSNTNSYKPCASELRDRLLPSKSHVKKNRKSVLEEFDVYSGSESEAYTPPTTSAVGRSAASPFERSAVSHVSKSAVSPVQRSALMSLKPPSCSSASSVCSDNAVPDPEIFNIGQDTGYSVSDDWDADKVLETEMSQMILRTARQKHSSKTADLKKRLLPSKLKAFPKPGTGQL